ncbi:MAG: thioredoxin-disulfide reductase [Oscillospiraceae bacterium]
MDHIYDLIILGGGPAGLSAALYAGRSRLDTLLLEQGAGGGQIAITSELENYPGSPENDSGADLIARMTRQADRFGAKRTSDTITAVDLTGDVKTFTGDKETYKARSVILATGAVPRPIGCPGEAEFAGRGVSYCATCDANFFRNLEVFVVGGGNSAAEEALYLTKFARKVTVIHRRDALRATKSVQEKLFANEKVSFLWDSRVLSLSGDGLLSHMEVENVKTGAITQIDADPKDRVFGVFVFIGLSPRTDLFAGQVTLQDGYVPTDEKMQTNLPGVYAAGDVRVTPLRQVVTAVSDGAIAATMVEGYLNR